VAVLIDTPVWPFRGRRWSHLVSDVSHDELHAFAATVLDIPRRAFQGDHYDVPEELYGRAVAAGAEAVGCQELLQRLLAAGLRVRKPRAPIAPSGPAAG
jgi:ATP phosphoribosyltransferase regulatory subunit HisZ